MQEYIEVLRMLSYGDVGDRETYYVCIGESLFLEALRILSHVVCFLGGIIFHQQTIDNTLKQSSKMKAGCANGCLVVRVVCIGNGKVALV